MDYKKETPVASASRTTTGNSGVLGGRYGGYTQIRAQLDVTAVTGSTPTLDVTIEDTLDGSNWNTIGTFTQATGVTREVIEIYPKETPGAGFAATFSGRFRIVWTIGGTTPDFTFSLDWVVK